MHLSKIKSWMIWCTDICFATQSFMLPKVTDTTKDQYRK